MITGLRLELLNAQGSEKWMQLQPKLAQPTHGARPHSMANSKLNPYPEEEPLALGLLCELNNMAWCLGRKCRVIVLQQGAA